MTEDKELKKSEEQHSEENAPQPQESSPAVNSDEINEENFDEYESEELRQLYEESFKNISEGEVVKGRILQVTENEVLVDVGYKSEGAIPITEFKAELEKDGLKVGDSIDVYLEKTEDSNGLVVLSKEKADKIKIWDQIQHAYENEEVLSGRVVERIKGGLNVDIGVKAFLPGSQIDLRPVRDPQVLIGQEIEMKVIKLNKRRGNIVLSRRAILEEQRKEMKEKTMALLTEGTIIKGIVKNITEYGAFIDLGGIDGLLHITDMSWGRVNHPSELFVIGDEVEVVVLKYDKEKERVSLGYKQKTQDPWETVDVKYPVGSKVRGKVISITDYGAFVELEEGVEGLVHVSEMSWSRRVRNHNKLVAIGDSVEAIVLNMDKDNKRISLGMKQVEPNPWKIIEEKYSVGAEVEGRVRNLTNFGAFVELDEGIDGLIHISDMSWTKRINHPSEVVKKGERIKAVILDIDSKNERLSLGLKQLQPDPWDFILEKYPVGSVVQGKVVRISEFGAFVELEDGIEGLVHVSELDRKHVNNPEEIVTIDETYSMKVIKIDPEERKIGLSIKAYKETIQQAEVDSYIAGQDKKPAKSVESKKPAAFGDAVKEHLAKQLKETMAAVKAEANGDDKQVDAQPAEESEATIEQTAPLTQEAAEPPLESKPEPVKAEAADSQQTAQATPAEQAEQEEPREVDPAHKSTETTSDEPEEEVVEQSAEEPLETPTTEASEKTEDHADSSTTKDEAEDELKADEEKTKVEAEDEIPNIDTSEAGKSLPISKLTDVDSMLSKIRHSIRSKISDSDKKKK